MSATYTGPVPAELDLRLQRRDTSPLPPSTLLRVQAINRGKNPGPNARFLVADSGEVFAAGHSGDSSDWQTPFDIPLPSTPTRRLSDDRLESLRVLLQGDAFAAEPPYQADETVEDGLFLVVTARTGKGVHEVIYEAILPPLVQDLLRLAGE
jgi:hypothetical protein